MLRLHFPKIQRKFVNFLPEATKIALKKEYSFEATSKHIEVNKQFKAHIIRDSTPQKIHFSQFSKETRHRKQMSSTLNFKTSKSIKTIENRT